MNRYSLSRPKRPYRISSPTLKSSLTVSHFPSRDYEKHFPKLSVEVKSIVICGCPQNVTNFLTQLKRFTVNNSLPDVTIIAPCEPPQDSMY